MTTTLAILSKYLRTATDGWTLAATSVRDLYAQDLYEGDSVSAADAGGDFAGEAHRLGAATAEVHRDLAEAFGTDGCPRSRCTRWPSRCTGGWTWPPRPCPSWPGTRT